MKNKLEKMKLKLLVGLITGVSFSPITSVFAETGVSGVDEGLKNLTSFLRGIIRGVGVIFLVLGLYKLAASFRSQDARERQEGIWSSISGLMIVFIPEIVNFVVPGTL